MTVVLDASALLALAQDEPGADEVAAVLTGAVVAAPNWAEFLTKGHRADAKGAEGAALLKALGVRVEPVGEDDAEVAAFLAAANPWLSLGDRFCLAVAERLERPAYTADKAWARAATGATVVLVR